MNGARRTPEPAPAVTSEERAGLLEPPDGLSVAEAKHWRALAPQAIARSTLVPATEAGFRELCARLAQVEAFDAKIVLVGADTLDALPFLKERRSWAKELNTSLKDFRLTGFGKPEFSDKPKKAVNPFAQVAG